MERGSSTQSLSSRGGSDMGSSRYLIESGFYLTSLAATIFVAALITVGVLFITLLVALTLMLQSCQSRNSGVVQLRETRVEYDYCKSFTLHAELNNLEVAEFPTICKAHAISYIKEGQYLRDLNFTIMIAENYFSNLTPQDDGLDVILIDIDDIFPSNPHRPHPLLFRSGQHDGSDLTEEAKYIANMLSLRLQMKLRSSGWSLIFITRKPEKQRNDTTRELISAGYVGWSSLIMSLDDEMQLDSWEFFSKRRTELRSRGFRITSIISSRMDALTGPCLGKRNFKLANPNSILYMLDPQNGTLEQIQ